jgi:O-antigen biosynthesis protein WbqP
MKNCFDFLIAIIALVVLLLPSIGIAFIIKLTSKGPVIFWSTRVGINNAFFQMPKFRTMHIDTPALATHLLDNPENHYTPIGSFLRKFSLDEIPQIISILKNEMSLVGPRPALFNQDDLIALRTQNQVHILKPGITGWAQVNGRDDISTLQKVELDKEYLKRKSFFFDIYILSLTLIRVLRSEGVSH